MNTLTEDLFGYKSVPCLECDGTGEELIQKTLVKNAMELEKY
jgi:hypothetical protein